MGTDLILTLLKDLDITTNVLSTVTKSYGLIERREAVEFENKPCWLVWDYLIYNDITLEERETGKQIRLFSSISDEKTEAKFNEIISKLNEIAQENRENKDNKKKKFFQN